MEKSSLYLILDLAICAKNDPLKIAEQALSGGVDIIQLRAKREKMSEVLGLAKKLKKMMPKETLLIINDDPDIAKASGADGLHLGQEDMPVKRARKILGKNKIIGLTCHSLEDIQKAKLQKADYIGLGTIFKTKTKPQSKAGGISLIKKIIKGKSYDIPFWVIGGINRKNLTCLCRLGVKRVAVCRAILKARNPYAASRQLKDILKHDFN